MTLMMTITAGVVQAKMLYFTSTDLLPPEREERAVCPVKKEDTITDKLYIQLTLSMVFIYERETTSKQMFS